MEIVVIAVVSLIFIGPSRLPETAKQMGKLFVKFRRATSEARSVVDDVIREAERDVVLEEHAKVEEQAALDTGSAQLENKLENN